MPTARFDFDPSAAVRAASERDDIDGVADLVSAHPLEMWFALRPTELQVLIASLGPERLSVSRAATWLARTLGGATTEPDAAMSPVSDDIAEFTHGVLLRAQGDPVASLEILQGTELVAAAAPPVFDPGRGLRAFAVAQAALSAMLSGRLLDALAYFEKALSCPVPNSLRFLYRESHLRGGLIHALFGDPDAAHRRAAAAREVPRTHSWAEEGLDAETVLLEALLRPEEEASLALDDILAVPLSAQGELWAFFLLGAYSSALLTGRVDEVHVRLRQLESVPPAGVNSGGLVGSALPWLQAVGAIEHGDLAVGRAAVDKADAGLWPTTIVEALLDIAVGRAALSVRQLEACSDQTRGLRVAERMRLTALVLARHSIGDLSDDELLAATRHDDAVSSGFLTVLAAATTARIGRDNSAPTESTTHAGSGVFDVEELRDRELEVLRALAEGNTRAEIAERLFLSVNTIKSHQRSLYRKLRVSTRAGAVLEAVRRDLL